MNKCSRTITVEHVEMTQNNRITWFKFNLASKASVWYIQSQLQYTYAKNLIVYGSLTWRHVGSEASDFIGLLTNWSTEYPAGCCTNVLRTLQNILSKCVYCRNRLVPCFGHTYGVSAWNSHHKYERGWWVKDGLSGQGASIVEIALISWRPVEWSILSWLWRRELVRWFNIGSGYGLVRKRPERYHRKKRR